jgi:hypothetical protein
MLRNVAGILCNLVRCCKGLPSMLSTEIEINQLMCSCEAPLAPS